MKKNIKIALVHDYLNEAGGAERVLRVLADMYPSAPIFTAFAKNGTAKAMFSDRVIIESAWAPILKIGRSFSYLRFLLPLIWKSIKITGYDVVITSTSGGYIARGFGVDKATKVVAYCHTPPKWLYGYDTPTRAGKLWWGKLFMWLFGPYLRYFDYQSAQRVDKWIANSKEVAGRINKFYRRDSVVIYPPIEMGGREYLGKDYYLIVSRITGAKGITEGIEGAIKALVRLKIVGENVSNIDFGFKKYEKWVEYLGRVDELQLADLYAHAKGFIALARDEDFGMTVVEAMSYGVPVLALNCGGYKETVTHGVTGIFVENTDSKSIKAGIQKMEEIKWNHQGIQEFAKKFGRARFEREIKRELAN